MPSYLSGPGPLLKYFSPTRDVPSECMRNLRVQPSWLILAATRATVLPLTSVDTRERLPAARALPLSSSVSDGPPASPSQPSDSPA